MCVRACFHPQISPKGDVWSLGCILYCMTYGRTPFQSITNQFAKLHAIIDPRFEINFPNMAEKDLLDVLKVRSCHSLSLVAVISLFLSPACRCRLFWGAVRCFVLLIIIHLHCRGVWCVIRGRESQLQSY